MHRKPGQNAAAFNASHDCRGGCPQASCRHLGARTGIVMAGTLNKAQRR